MREIGCPTAFTGAVEAGVISRSPTSKTKAVVGIHCRHCRPRLLCKTDHSAMRRASSRVSASPRIEDASPWSPSSSIAHDATVNGNATEPDGGAWNDPDFSILDDRRGKLPKFPIEAFSPDCQAWLRRAAAGAGVTVDHVAVPLLGVISSLVGTARRIEATRSWLTPVTTWTAVVGLSGTGKTPGLDVLKNALALIEGASEYRKKDQ